MAHTTTIDAVQSSIGSSETISMMRGEAMEAAVRLGPVACLLCQSIDEYRKHLATTIDQQLITAGQRPVILPAVPASDVFSATATTAGIDRRRSASAESNVLRILQNMAHLLDDLQNQVSVVGSEIQSSRTTSEATSKAISKIMEYVTLPLLTILQVVAQGSWDVVDSSTTSATVVQSAQWKCVERASRVLKSTLTIATNTAAGMPQPRYIECIAVCVSALPPVAAIETRRLTTVGRLDTGDDCIVSLLSTLQSLISTLSDKSDAQMKHVVESGWLLPLLVDACVALVEPPVVDAPPNGAPQSHQQRHDRNSKHREPSILVQQVAAETIQCIIQTLPNIMAWRRVFPGVYAGLYRRILSSIRVSQAQPSVQRVVLQCVGALTKLLSSSLAEIRAFASSSKKVTSSSTSVLEQLQSLAKPAKVSVETGKATNKNESKREDEFLSQIQQRVPSTLSVLVSMLASSRSLAIRQQSVELLHAALIATRHCWSDDLVITCSESLLVLCCDSAIVVASKAKAVLHEYSQISSFDIDEVVIPRLVDLIERLELLVQSSSRGPELQASLKLITGYLTLYGLSNGTVKDLRKALCAETISSTLRRSLVTLLDVQLEGDTDFVHSSRAMVVSGTTASISPGSRLRYLQEETERSACDMIQAFGKVFGPKKAAVFVDACIADIYTSCVQRADRRESFQGQSHVMWLHEHIGAIRLVQELIVGAFTAEVGAAASDKKSKSERKRLGYLISLGNAILPILTSSPLWDLATSASRREDKARPEPKERSLVSSRESATSVVALRGNAIMICNILGLIATIVALVGDEVSRFTAVLLYPLLEKAGQGNVDSVRTAAVASLHTLATYSGSSSIASLLAAHMETFLMGSMLAKVRVPGGKALSPETALQRGLQSVIDSAIVVFRMVQDENGPNDNDAHHQSCSSVLVNMEELTMELTGRFDHASTRLANGTEVALQFLMLFHAALGLLRAVREGSSDSKRSETNEQAREPWLDLLAPYKRRLPDARTPKEGFEALRAEQRQRSEFDETEQIGKTDAGLTRDIDFVSRLAWRCGYLLSHWSLRIQMESCDALISCFAFLGWVAASVSTRQQQANGPKTAVLRQVHASWPAIGARLKATCTAVTIPKATTSLIIVSQPVADSAPTNVGEQRLYLSKLLELASAMVECSDDFMASRFRESIWPMVRSILRESTSETSKRNGALVPRNAPVSFRRQGSRTESEVTLLLAAMRCVSRVFGHRPVGIVLSGLIPSVGVEFWPFLDDHNGHVAIACVDAIQTMIRIDCDALWRPIFLMTERPFPSCPLLPWKTDVPRVDPVPNAQGSRVVAVANQLLDFIDSLPEQIIE